MPTLIYLAATADPIQGGALSADDHLVLVLLDQVHGMHQWHLGAHWHRRGWRGAEKGWGLRVKSHRRALQRVGRP